MRSRSCGAILFTLIVCSSGLVRAAQRGWIRDWVREHGDLEQTMISCGPPVGIREIVEHTQLTIEGTVSQAESALSADEGYVYTDYVIDVSRVFRMITRAAERPEVAGASPFLGGGGAARPGPVGVRARFRLPYTGKVTLDGGTVTARSGLPTLEIGQHVIVSAYYNLDLQAWVPFGIFEVRSGQVVGLDAFDQNLKYDSVEAFAWVLANPPPTTAR